MRDISNGLRSAAPFTISIAPVAEQLRAAADELARRQAAAVRMTFPSYRNGTVPDATLIASARRNVERVVNTLLAGKVPRPEEIHEAWVAKERAEQGIPADDMINAYRICQRLLGDAVIEQAAVFHLDGRTTAEATRLLWEMTDVVTSRMTVVRHEAELELARYDEHQRLDFLRNLLFGSVAANDLAGRGAVYGLSPDQPYFAVRARPNDWKSAETLKRAIETTGRRPGVPGLVGVIDGDVAGVTPERPDIGSLPTTVGVGGPAPLEAMEHAFQSASRMLSVGLRFGQHGTVSLEDLSLRVAVASEPELGALLVDRYLSPLEGEFGELIVETVRQFLDGGQRILETSRRLGIHPNTLRYRLDRFERLTGADLSRPFCVLEIWWALECRRLATLRPLGR